MQEKNKNIIHYNATDIQNYLQGKLSPQEMNAIEKAALDDPFLADAIEGIQNSETNFSNDAIDLKKRLEEKVQKNKKATLIPSKHLWQRVAAISIILIGSTSLIYHSLTKKYPKEKDAIAKNNKDIKPDSTISPKKLSAAPSKSDSVFVINDVAINEKKQPASHYKKENRKIIVNENLAVEQPQEKQKEIVADSSATLSFSVAKNDEKDKTLDVIHIDALKKNRTGEEQKANNVKLRGIAAFKESNRQSNIVNNFVQGQIIDENKNPVPGATIIIKGKKTTTNTDQNGYFKFGNISSDSTTNIIINSVGFQPTSATLNNNDVTANKIQIKPSTSPLSEVVVVGYGATRKKSVNDNDEDETSDEPKEEQEKVFNALPITGWPAYNGYINQNKKITTADSTIKGKEIISFIVDKNNQLSSFKIKKSLSKSHDAESLRLIQKGPSWKLLKGKKEKITLAIEF
jgi:hypothetical protein